MTDEADSKGILRDRRPLPPELGFIAETSARIVASTEVDDFYGISENSPYFRTFHGTRDFKLPMIAEEGLRAFMEHSRMAPKIYATVNPLQAARHAFYNGPHDTLRSRGDITGESVAGNPIVLMIQLDKQWLRSNPDSQKPIDSPYLISWSSDGRMIKVDTRLEGFKRCLKDDVEALKRGDELSSFGLPLPADHIPQDFIFVVAPEGNIPIDQYSITTTAVA
ncbi:MAG: hypothetical protein A2186_02100 [Candidatus Levybacteria bacterium RIFOXYA1_FULL_41_10]|nr:MAG: hypothetical protein UT87_C0026G0007 [Candidatus Levybacteria bacterium GW2011_GWC1_40_19]KKR95137.1 MAG: hypothetical protein UU45_C0004G0040 [Candidatus Levybacteria bacterium GW2011_GWA2_41_15]KKS00814.1 MAG: hypothetical protein UU52_C0026G0002 [Candidatus Levybacteria bacterium GW2011_GWB1_41_21]OGH24709.1 MAG: hypothetical protein A3D82_00675 [Candidatus Levybacteria bacterium RIFCSPHIGHO2_02_FULL_40_29]OGH32251.1 MAG: hypothetical protein A3E70_02005 [Candidatus Levybacteria bact